MSPMASQITGFTNVYSVVCSGPYQRKHQSFASLAFESGIQRWPVNSKHKGPVMRKMFPFDYVIIPNASSEWWWHRIWYTRWKLSGGADNRSTSWHGNAFRITGPVYERNQSVHCSDVTMCTMASQITSLTIVYSTVYSGTQQRNHQSFASLAFVRGIHRWLVNCPHKRPVTRKMFPFDDVIMHR